MNENKITTTIGALPKDKLQFQSAELEKDEVIFDPNKGTLHKVIGNTHAKGGTPVDINEGTFVFSNYKKLALNKNDLEEMSFKENSKKSQNTPSKVIQREIGGGLKHHNKMIDILNKGREYDQISKQSAELMLMKNMEKIGQVAFKQEEKKNFPQGMPQVSQNTAPVMTPELENFLAQSKQYKLGGIFSEGGEKGKGKGTPSHTYDRPEKIKEKDPLYGTDKLLQQYFNDLYSLDPVTYSFVTDNKIPLRQRLQQVRQTQVGEKLNPFVQDALSKDAWNLNHTLAERNNFNTAGLTQAQINNNYIDPIKGGSRWGQDRLYTYEKEFENKQLLDEYIKSQGLSALNANNGYYWKMDPNKQYTGAILKYKQPPTTPAQTPTSTSTETTTSTSTPRQADPITGNPPNKPTLNNFGPKQYNIGLTPWQKLNAAIPFAQMLAQKAQYPMRQHQQSVIPEVETFSAQPYLNQNNQTYFNAAGLNRLNTSQQMSIAANEELAAKRMDANNQVIGDIENKNVQLRNAMYAQAAQIQNQDADANRQFDQKYYDQTVTATQNRDDARQNLFNQGMSNLNNMMSEVTAYNNWLNSQQQVKTDVYDKNGLLIGHGSALPYEPKKGFFGINTAFNPNLNPEAVRNYNLGFNKDTKDNINQEFLTWATTTLKDPAADQKVKAMAASILSRYAGRKLNQ